MKDRLDVLKTKQIRQDARQEVQQAITKVPYREPVQQIGMPKTESFSPQEQQILNKTAPATMAFNPNITTSTINSQEPTARPDSFNNSTLSQVNTSQKSNHSPPRNNIHNNLSVQHSHNNHHSQPSATSTQNHHNLH